MTASVAKPPLTSALEDYLETVYELVRDNKLARVKDIARARGVRSASVSPAMKRLAELDLVRYVHREYIDLTPAGEEEGRRIFARHQLLSRFFNEVLAMPPERASEDACAMEHSLSPDGMDHLVRFFEFLGTCPEGQRFLDRFNTCPRVRGEAADCPRSCECSAGEDGCAERHGEDLTLARLRAGERARVVQVNGGGALRQRLLDMGVLPNVELELQRVAPVGDPLWIRLEGFQVSLRRREAQAVVVARL
jgi:DtxR family Mn-dependent transcriptional regulator